MPVVYSRRFTLLPRRHELGEVLRILKILGEILKKAEGRGHRRDGTRAWGIQTRH